MAQLRPSGLGLVSEPHCVVVPQGKAECVS